MFSEQNLHKYGTPLPLLEFDQVPSKKPVYVQDQIATDEQGRRRFHGAFTGGFSAGYWNTVGSKEGWTPQSFKSSRSEKTGEKISQKPEDFMDEEDRGEFGIAPKGFQINEDFTSASEQTEKRKRKFLNNDLQPIPGEPVLHQLIKPIKDKAAVRILKTWGWKPGQGIGPRQTKKEKKKARERNKKELYLMEKYGCEIPKANKDIMSDDEDVEDVDSEEDEEITFAPEDCELLPYKPKLDKYGLGYEPLSRQSVLGKSSTLAESSEHINFFKPLEVAGKNNQKISFSGQAFGVGALEEDDDEDVYALDDMARYDFSLDDKKTKKTKHKPDDLEELVFNEFILDRNPPKLPIYKVDIPFGWHPRNWNERRSRFEPLDPRKQRTLENTFSIIATEKEMTREKRAELLGEEMSKIQPSSSNEKTKETKTKTVAELQQEYKKRTEKTNKLMEKISAKSCSFTKGGLITMDGGEEPYTNEDISSTFKPFATDERKQKRYEQFLAKEFKTEQEIEDFLKTIQPIELSLWDRRMELKEFQQAKKLYRPLKGIMSDRFITESEIKAVQMDTKKVDTKQIVVERSKVMWKPHSLLCKRYNIAEPFRGLREDDKNLKTKQKKLSVFDYLETSVNKKEDFQTPVIIPRNIEKPKELVKQQSEPDVCNENKSVESTPLEWQEVINPTKKPNIEKKAYAFKPKTELERKVVESINKPVAEKKELFKSIFSDSESDDEEEEKEEINKKDPKELLSITNKPLSAAAVNLLRNNSPPRGIFKALFTANTTNKDKEVVEIKERKNETITETHIENVTKIPFENNKILFLPKASRELKESENKMELPTDVYGPVLLKNVSVPKPTKLGVGNTSIDDKLLELYNKHKPKFKVTEKWVEKKFSEDESSDSVVSSESDNSNGSTSPEKSEKHKKKVKKIKKEKSSDHKHKKHKDNKSSKKSKKHGKKKKKKKLKKK